VPSARPDVISLTDAFSRIHEYWRPRLVGSLNGQAVKLSRLHGEFIWHHHADEDELFLVTTGRLRIDFRDATGEWSSEIGPGELIVVPRGLEHRPVAAEPVELLLFEPLGTRNTGTIEDAVLTAPTDTPL